MSSYTLKSILVGAAVAGFTFGPSFVGASAAHADTVTLKNGREINGRLIEERKDSIRIRTVGGTITISKAEVATFTENPDEGVEYGGKSFTGPAPKPEEKPEAGQPAAGQPAAGQPAAGQPAAGQPSSEAKAAWKWDAAVTPEQQEALTPLRDKLFAELEALGPTKAERLAAAKPAPGDDAVMNTHVQGMGWKRRQGSANMRREAAKQRLIDDFGLKALPKLVESLSSSNQWIARMSAAAVADLAKGKDAEAAKWLFLHFKAPDKLISLVDHQGEIDSPYVRQTANAALEALTGTTVGFQGSTSPVSTPAEAAAYKKWTQWWSKEQVAWEAKQKQSEARRAEIAGLLASIQKGVDPTQAADAGS